MDVISISETYSMPKLRKYAYNFISQKFMQMTHQQMSRLTLDQVRHHTFMLQFFRLCSKYQALQTWTSLSKTIDPANAVQIAVVHRSVSWLALKTP